MYGAEAIELLKELRRAAPHLVPPYNVSESLIESRRYPNPVIAMSVFSCPSGCPIGTVYSQQRVQGKIKRVHHVRSTFDWLDALTLALFGWNTTKKEDRLRKVIAEIEGLFREVQKTLT